MNRQFITKAMLLAVCAVLTVGLSLAVAHCGRCGHEEAVRKDIVDTAVAADFDTLAAALTAADLVDALKGEGPFTVFAPTDQAFENLPDGALADLLKPENKAQLQAVLKFHVVAGRHMAADLVELESVETLQGEELALNFEDETLTVGGAEVTSADVECSNGVIHVINKVLLP
jgi:uncharacterized surface protein with fasciclin (FAS1) repeats